MPTTPRLALPYPSPPDSADVPADMGALANAIDAKVPGRPRWGGVTATATVWQAGSGDWTPSHLSTGRFRVTFQTALIRIPLITITPAAGASVAYAIDQSTISVNLFDVLFYDVFQSMYADTNFMFSAWDIP